MKIFSKCSWKHRKNLENFGNMDLLGVPSENIKRFVEKSMETCKILKIFMNFYFKKLILIKIKASLEFWKSFIILKEIKKPRGKFLRVWAKNQLRFEIFQKILKFTYKNLNGKEIFTFFSSIFQVHRKHLIQKNWHK